MFWNLVPITDDELKSRMKHLWSPIPPLWGRMYALTHSIPAVAYTASIGMILSLNVGGICVPVQPKHYLLKLRSDCSRHFAIHPEYTFLLKSPSRMISASVAFHTNNWAISCSKNIVFTDLKSPLALKYCSCCSRTVVPAEWELLEPEGWYAITILVFLSPEPTLIQHHLPRPQWSTPVSTTSAENRPIAIIAQPPCWLRFMRSLILWATTLRVSILMPITFRNCCSSVAWHQSTWVSHPANISVLNLQQSLFKALIFTPFVKTPRLSKFSITTWTQLSGLAPGALPYAVLRQKSSICQVIWFLAPDSCWAIWKAVSARWELFFLSRAVQFFLCIDAISSVADGGDILLKSLVPVSNCFAWALKRRVASDSDQQLPRQAWRSLAINHLCRWLLWPLLLLDSAGSCSFILGFTFDRILVATWVVPPFFVARCSS